MEDVALTPNKSPTRAVTRNSPYCKEIERGNSAYEEGRYQAAIDEWSNSIDLTTNNDSGNIDLLKLLYSNRSAAYSKLQQYSSALIDANKCVELDPYWLKGIMRKGDVLMTLSRYSEAHQTYQHGVNMAPLNEVIFEKCVQARKSKERMEKLMQTPGGTKLIEPEVVLKPFTMSEKLKLGCRLTMLVLLILFISPTGLMLQELCFQVFLLLAVASFGVTLHQKYGEPDNSVPIREIPRYEAWQRVMKDRYFVLLVYCSLLLCTSSRHIWWLIPVVFVECSAFNFSLQRMRPYIENMPGYSSVASNIRTLYETLKSKLMNRDINHRTDAISEDDEETPLFIDEHDIPDNKSWFREVSTTVDGGKCSTSNDGKKSGDHREDSALSWNKIVSFFGGTSTTSVPAPREKDIENAELCDNTLLFERGMGSFDTAPTASSSGRSVDTASLALSNPNTADEYLAARVSPFLDHESPERKIEPLNGQNRDQWRMTEDKQDEEKRNAEMARQLEIELDRQLKEEEEEKERMKIAEEEYEIEMKRQEAEAAAFIEAKKAAAEQEAARLQAEKETEGTRSLQEYVEAEASAAQEPSSLKSEVEVVARKASEEAIERELAEEVMRREKAALEAALRDEEEYNKQVEDEKLKRMEIANATVRAAEAIMYANADEAEVNRLNALPVAQKLQLIAEEEKKRTREELSKKLDEEALNELRSIQNEIIASDENSSVDSTPKDYEKSRSFDDDDSDRAHRQRVMAEKQLVEDEKEIVDSTAAKLIEIQERVDTDNSTDEALEEKINKLMKEAETQLLAHIKAKQKSREKKTSKKLLENETLLSATEKEKLKKQRQKAEKSRQKFDALALRKFEADVRKEAGFKESKYDTAAAEKLKEAEEEFEVALMEAEKAHRDKRDEVQRLRKDKEAWKQQLLNDVDCEQVVIRTPDRVLTPPTEKHILSEGHGRSQKSPSDKFKKELDRLEEEEKYRKALQVRLDFEMLKSMNRQKFDHAITQIHSLIAGVVQRRRIRKLLFRLPHIVIIKLISAEDIDIRSEANTLTFGAVPDVFVSIVGHTYWGECFSRQQSNVVPGDQLIWNEKHLVSLAGENGYIALNVMSRATLTGDSFVGQAVVDLSQLVEEFAQQLPGEEFTLDLPLSGRLSFNLHNIVGQECESQPEQKEDKGYLRVRVSMASPFSNMCGWFYEVSTSIFGVVDRQKIWVVLHRNNANKWFVLSYDSKFSGDAGLKRTIDVDTVVSVEMKMPANGMEDGALEMLLGPSNETVTWAFGEETREFKGMWIRCLFDNIKR